MKGSELLVGNIRLFNLEAGAHGTTRVERRE